MNRAFLSTVFIPAVLAGGCGEKAELEPAPEVMEQKPPPPVIEYEKAAVTEARVQFPRFLEVEKKVIARTCSPNPGVCHQTNNYPDMRTAGSVLAMIGAPCNLEIPDAHQGWDGCELPGDRVVLGQDVAVELGWVERSGPEWILALREAAAETKVVPLELVSHDRELIFAPPRDWRVTVAITEGSAEARLTVDQSDPYVVDLVRSMMRHTTTGDANRNGRYGADEPERSGALIYPGSLEKSYLWGRLTGTVPGSRMPLANQPLSNAEYVALACWIELLDPDGEPSALDTIDYDACNFAKNPIEYSTF